MRGLIQFFRLFALVGFVSTAATIQAQENYRAGVLHVKFKQELANQVAGMRVHQSARGTAITGISAVDQISAARGARTFKRVFREAGRYEAAHRAFGLHLWYEIEYDSTLAVSLVKGDYERTGQFEKVEQPRKVYQIGPSVSEVNKSILPLAVNDPLFGNQWHYENTGQTGGTPGADVSLVPAWTVETGSNQVIVAVIDGGIDILHPDLAAAMWVNTDEVPGNGVDDDLNGYVDDVNGFGFGDNTGTLFPHFHGTHVAGTIGAVTNNGVGVAGIAGGTGSGNGVRLMSCAGFGEFGTGGFEDAMVYAADNGAVISQNSWGGGSTAIEAAIDYFVARAGLDNSAANFGLNIQIGPMRGGVVIFAAGNSNTDNPAVGYPGSYPAVIAVASTDHNDTRSSFSNYGTWVDIAAPGSSVYSTYPVSMGSYALLSGTSMACPHVSGAAALVVSKFKAPGFLPGQVWGRLQETADNIDAQNPSFIGLLGGGRLNAFNALQTDDGVPPDPISNLAVSNEHLTSIELTWTATGGSGSVGAASFYDLRYSTAPITEANFSSAPRDLSVPNPKVAGLEEVYAVQGLLPTTTYYFALKAGDFFGNISSISNVVSATTPEPPIIGVSPSSLSETLFTGGQAFRFLTISNTGASDLIFDLAIQSIAPGSVSTAGVGNGKIFAGLKQSSASRNDAYRNLAQWHSNEQQARVKSSVGPSPNAAGRIFLLTSPAEIAEISSVDGSVINTIPTPEPASGGPDGLAFDGQYLYFINSFGSITYYKIDPDDGSVVQTLSLPETGSIDALGHSGTYLYALDYGTATIFEIDFNAGVVVRSISPGVPLGGGMSFGGSRGTLFVSNFGSTIYEIDIASGDVTNTITPTGTIYGLGYSEGAGLLFAQNVSTNRTEAYNPETGAVEFSLASGFSSALASDEGGNQWLKVGEGSVVAAGESIQVLVTFDADGLNGGDYLSNILVHSNDPVTPLVTIPASLHVDGAPNIARSPTALEFGDTFINTQPTLTVKITNDGTDVLTVTNFSIFDPEFSIEAGGSTPFSLAPGESHDLTIRFSPVVVGEILGYVYIDSNDPDQPTVSVPLFGNAIEPPIIEVAPASIASSLYTGETEDHPMTIQNSGGSNLLVDLEIEFVDIASASTQTIQPTSSSSPNNNGVVLATGNAGYYPQAAGDFTALSNSPDALTCFTIDPASQILYGQRNGGNQFYRYDPSTNLWSSLASSPVASGNNGGATYLDGKVYIFYIGINQMAVYDIASNTWTNTSTPINTGNVTSDGSYLYAAVGSVFKRFTPSSNTWSDLATPTISFQPWGGLVHYNGIVYGHAGNGSSEFAAYSISGNTWTTLPSLPGGAVLGATIDPAGKNYYTYGSYGGTNMYIYNIPSGIWSVVQIPLFSINDGGLAFVKKSGKRGVYFLQGESGIGFAKFETGGASWLNVVPESGEVGSGETLSLIAHIDATGLDGGEYSATINVISNDPLNPLVVVPVTLTVTGAPDVVVSPVNMNFGQEFVDGEKSYELIISNEGTDLLTIASADSDTPVFTVGQPATSLLPGETETIQVTFRPTAPGSFVGRITIQTNDPDEPATYVDLEGLAVIAPLVGVSPVSITSNLFSNQQEERTLTVQNTGGSLLEFNVNVVMEDFAGFPSPSVTMVKPNASPGNNNYGLPEASYPNNLVPMAPGDFSSLAPSPLNMTCMTIDPVTHTIYAQQNQGNGFYKYDDTTNVWSSLTTCPIFSGNNGGAVFLNGKIYTVYTGLTQMGIYTLSTNTWTIVGSPTNTGNIATNGTYIYTVVGYSLYRYDPSGGSWIPMAPPPFYFEPWGALVFDNGFLYGHQGNGTAGFAKFTIATNSWTTLPSLPSEAVLGGAIDTHNKVYYTYGSYGGTNLYAFDLTTNTWSTRSIPLFTLGDGGLVYVKKPGKQGIYFIQGESGNGFAKFETGGGNWLLVETESGEVGGGETMSLIAHINATGLNGGEYSATINFNSNDPLTPLVTVPVTLTVTGAPDVFLSPIGIDFGQEFVGGEKSYELTISNEGTDVLSILSANSNSPQFTVGQPVASLAPGELDTVFVTFRPTASGSFTGKITVQTNDPDDPFVYVDLWGIGAPPPIIGVTPSSLSETLLTGEQVTRMLTIRNTGATDLTFGKTVQVQSVEAGTNSPGYDNGRVFAGLKPVNSTTTDAYGLKSSTQSTWPAASPKPSSSPSPASAGRIFILSGPNTIAELSTVTGAIIRTMPTPEPASGGQDGLAFDGSYLYFTNGIGSQKYYRLDPVTGTVHKELSLPATGEIDALAHSGTFLYAQNYSSGIIFEIDFDAGVVVRSISPGVAIGGGMSFGGSRGTLFVSYFNLSIYEIDLTSGDVINTFTPTGTIYGLGYSEEAGLLFAQNVSTGKTDAYDPDTGFLYSSLPTGFSSALASDEAGSTWLKVGAGSFVAAGQSIQVSVDFDAEGLDPGEYSATIKFESNDPVHPVVTVPVTLTVTLPVGIKSDPLVDLTLSPNPASRELHASFNLEKMDVVEFSLTDLTGKTIWVTSETRDAGQHNFSTSVDALPEGLYLFRFSTSSYITTRRLVILRK